MCQSAEGSFQVKLQETKTFRGKYACLSHRLGPGGSDQCKTTHETYSAMLNNIPWDTIPKTFQDATKFVFALGIHYLWIDTYCIIQGDEDDRQSEAKKMASVYQHSYITIAATTAANNEAGCLWLAGQPCGRAFTIDGIPSSDPIGLFVRKVVPHWERIWTSNIESRYPLLTRAWVFQERLLSPRVLHFSDQEMIWVCGMQGDCQCTGFDGRSNAKSLDWSRRDAWRSAVELYTSLKLTVESDRLPAIHCFAEYCTPHFSIAGFLDKNYFAGLWKDSIHLDLLWRVDSLECITSEHPLLNRLCLCWDNIEHRHFTSHTCQYSYGAACSTACLEQRRLCLHGRRGRCPPRHRNQACLCISGGAVGKH